MDEMTTTQWTRMRPLPKARPNMQTRTDRMICRCGARDGWGKLINPWDDDVWVCVWCGGPSAVAEEKRMGLAYFRGGPLDGRAYEVSQLTREVTLAPYIIQYNWTPEIVTSELTGKNARVWAFKEAPDELARQAEAASQLPPAQPVPGTEPGQEGAEGMTESTGTAVSTAGLRDRREKLGASRTDIERHSGLTVPMIARIEKGGPSTKQEEADKYKAALDQIERDGGAKKASPRGKKAAKTAAASDGAKEGGDTKGTQSPPPSEASSIDTGGVVRLHEWNGFTFTPRAKGDMSGGSPIKWSKSPSAAFTFVAFSRDANGKEIVDLWETRRRRIRYANPADVSAPKTRRRRAS